MTIGMQEAWRAAMLNHAMGKTSMTQPTSFQLSAHTGDPGATGSSNEVSGNNYSRVTSIPPSEWDAATSADPSVIALNTDQDFPTPSGSWGTITHIGVWDQASNYIGTMLVPGGGVAISGASDLLRVLSGSNFSIAET